MREKTVNKFDNDEILIDNESASTRRVNIGYISIYGTFAVINTHLGTKTGGKNTDFRVFWEKEILNKFDNDEILIDNESGSTTCVNIGYIYLYMAPFGSLIIPPLRSKPGVKHHCMVFIL